MDKDKQTPSVEELLNRKVDARTSHQILMAEIRDLKHNISVRDKIELWPTWKIKGVDSYRLIKGSILDRLFNAEDEIERLKEELRGKSD